jgi:hypothetical protein
MPNLQHANLGTTEQSKASVLALHWTTKMLQTHEFGDKAEGHLQHGQVQACLSPNTSGINE